MSDWWFYLLLPYAIIGFLFVLLATTGIAINGIQSGIALDRWLGTCLIKGHLADEMISAWAHRKHHRRFEHLINWIFQDPNHCAKAYVAEMRGIQKTIDSLGGDDASPRD